MAAQGAAGDRPLAPHRSSALDWVERIWFDMKLALRWLSAGESDQLRPCGELIRRNAAKDGAGS
jgi:hypothetical protein